LKKTPVCNKNPVKFVEVGTFQWRQARKVMDGDISSERKSFLEKDFTRGFIAHCGFEGEVVAKGSFRSTVRIEDVHRQQDGFIHAGVMATMADHTAGYAAFTTVAESFQILTIEFKINFLRPAHGDSLVCKSRVIRDGSQIIIAESEVFDQREGKEFGVAKALVTLMAVPREKISSKG
jgi:uncharacterized protein (TIGR00369 family)